MKTRLLSDTCSVCSIFNFRKGT